PFQAVKTFTIGIVPDSNAEADEEFTVTLTNPQQATLGSPAVATVTISDNDKGGTIEFASSVYAVSEYRGFAFIEVKRTGGAAGSVTVDLQATGGTASAGDYTLTDPTLTFLPTETSLSAFLTVYYDFTAEPPETINLTLSNPTGGAVLGPKSTAVI